MSASTQPPANKPKILLAASPSSNSKTKQQSSLLQFFGNQLSSSPPPEKKQKPSSASASASSSRAEKKPKPSDKNDIAENNNSSDNKNGTGNNNDNNNDHGNNTNNKARQASTDCGSGTPSPIIPTLVRPNPKYLWTVVDQSLLIRQPKPTSPFQQNTATAGATARNKVAAFDVDGTLLLWRVAQWPSQLDQYELWSSKVIAKLQHLHDHEHYHLVLFTNQGGIRGAFTGKKATHVKSLIEWLAQQIDRPLLVFTSTKSKEQYHKPSPKMFDKADAILRLNNGNVPLDLEQSFYVGDSVVRPEDPQGGVDEKFAAAVGLKFHEPTAFFGPSDASRRQGAVQPLQDNQDAPPLAAQQAYAGLFGGYLRGPIMLMLAGVQGSGKSTFCSQLLSISTGNAKAITATTSWIHLSQDTINKGTPGKREAVEAHTRDALKQGKCVVVDRMHIQADQRKHFVDIAKELNVPVHIILFQPPDPVILDRVRNRKNHVAGVEGDKGVRIVTASLGKVTVPSYKQEGFDLIHVATRDERVQQLSTLYGNVLDSSCTVDEQTKTGLIPTNATCTLSNCISMPMLALGTMGIGKRKTTSILSEALQKGRMAVDTAPTYKNELEVGAGLTKDAFIIVKVPKRVTQAPRVREEIDNSLRNLNRVTADLLLLHWPCDVIEAGTLKEVWQAMEECVNDGTCRALGVCNFTVNALRQLLPHCTTRPSVNQVERHPWLPQWELVQFCQSQNILVQAHTPLGHGKLLEFELVQKIAVEANMTPAQVLLKWNLQQGVAVVPKCSSTDHVSDVLKVFDASLPALSALHMKQLDDIQEHRRFVSPPFMKIPGKVYTWQEK